MSPLRILVVDDDADVADSLADVLELHGHEVTVAYSGQEAIDGLTGTDFDLAFMDVMMPGKNGVESLIEIKKFKPDTKVIMMTGFSVEQLLNQAIEEGAAGVLHKPIAVEEVLSKLEDIQQHGNRKSMVLVADDDEDFSAALEQILCDQGFAVQVAHTGEAALSTLVAEAVDLLVLDLDLPILSGIEVYYEMKKRGRAVPTIIVTGNRAQGEEVRDSIRDPVVSGILFKPFDPSVLLTSLHRLLDGPG